MNFEMNAPSFLFNIYAILKKYFFRARFFSLNLENNEACELKRRPFKSLGSQDDVPERISRKRIENESSLLRFHTIKIPLFYIQLIKNFYCTQDTSNEILTIKFFNTLQEDIFSEITWIICKK